MHQMYAELFEQYHTKMRAVNQIFQRLYFFSSVLYIDNPVGTGFSFTDSKAGYPNYVNESSEDLFHALQQFFQMFHEYKDRCVL